MSLTITLTALATAFLSKMTDQVLDKAVELGDAALDSIGDFLHKLRDKNPETAKAIERVRENPAKADREPATYGLQALTNRLDQASQNDPELAAALHALGNLLKQQVEEQTGETIVFSNITAKGDIKAGDIDVTVALGNSAKIATNLESRDGGITLGDLTVR